jgi:tripartite-type tricarboxylate transporter receptor subunit TctC
MAVHGLNRRSLISGAVCFGVAAGKAAQAQGAFPQRPVRVIIPFAPAGGTDIASRLLGERLGEVLGQQIVADNRPGANGIIAGEALRQSPPDGHTLLIATAASFAAAPALGQKLPYDVERDFMPVAMLGLFPLVLNVSPDLPVKDLRSFIEMARTQPGKLNYASAGVGGTNHLVFEMFMQATGIKMTHVPYRGAALAATDVMSGQVHAMVDSLASSLPNIEGGRIKALAVTTAGRQPQLPSLPSFAEQGINLVYPGWASFVAPAGTPDGLIQSLNGAINKALDVTALRSRYRDLVIETAQWTPTETAIFMREDRRVLTELVQKTGIKVE